jgi:hypothetical protein
VFSGLFFNGAESWRDPECYKKVVEIEALNESVESRRGRADPVGAGRADDPTRVL